MNGMQRKKQARDRSKRFTEEGLPRDGKEWTRDDWADLHYGLEEIKRKIRERHKEPKQ
jgi:hypothetical protein